MSYQHLIESYNTQKREFGPANQAYLPRGDIACICQSVKVCHSTSEDTKTMTYQGRISSSHDEYSPRQFELQFLLVTFSFDAEHFILVMKKGGKLHRQVELRSCNQRFQSCSTTLALLQVKCSQALPMIGKVKWRNVGDPGRYC